MNIEWRTERPSWLPRELVARTHGSHRIAARAGRQAGQFRQPRPISRHLAAHVQSLGRTARKIVRDFSVATVFEPTVPEHPQGSAGVFFDCAAGYGLQLVRNLDRPQEKFGIKILPLGSWPNNQISRPFMHFIVHGNGLGIVSCPMIAVSN
jgi:hypothetical protein